VALLRGLFAVLACQYRRLFLNSCRWQKPNVCEVNTMTLKFNQRKLQNHYDWPISMGRLHVLFFAHLFGCLSPRFKTELQANFSSRLNCFEPTWITSNVPGTKWLIHHAWIRVTSFGATILALINRHSSGLLDGIFSRPNVLRTFCYGCISTKNASSGWCIRSYLHSMPEIMDLPRFSPCFDPFFLH